MAARLPRTVCATPAREAVTVAALALALFVTGSSMVPLLGRDEARFAEASREMLARGELVVPTFAGVERYHKPILSYWCTAASFALLGVSEAAARLPSNIAAALTVLLVAWTARRRWGEGAGLLAGALLAVTVCFHVEARACTADMVMMLPTVAAMLALERLVLAGVSWRHAAVFWVGMALAVLAKGPVAPSVALATGVMLWALGRRWRGWELGLAGAILVLGWLGLGVSALAVPLLVSVVAAVRSPAARSSLAALRWWWGVPLLLVIVLPWAAAAYRATDGAFLRVGVGHHVVARSLTPFESHAGFPGFYLVTAVVVAFPWFAILIPAVGEALRRARQDRGASFLVAWLVGPMIALELVATKLVHYWMPAYPAAILLVVGWLATRRDRPATLPLASRLVALAGALVLAGLPLAAVIHFGLDHLRPVAGLVAMPMILWLVVAVLPAARSARRQAVTAAAAAAAYLVMVVMALLPRLAEHTVAPQVAEMIPAVARPGERVLVYKARDDELFFYLPLETVNCRSSQCLAKQLTTSRSFLGVARVEELEAFRAEHPQLQVDELESVRGLDLGHGRWATVVLFRPAASERMASARVTPQRSSR